MLSLAEVCILSSPLNQNTTTYIYSYYLQVMGTLLRLPLLESLLLYFMPSLAFPCSCSTSPTLVTSWPKASNGFTQGCVNAREAKNLLNKFQAAYLRNQKHTGYKCYHNMFMVSLSRALDRKNQPVQWHLA